MTTLVWLRRDLRLHDHAPLATALAESAPVQPVFVFDTDILARFSNPRDRRLSFIAATLVKIDDDLRARGGRLLVLHGKATEIIPKLARTLKCNKIVSARDFEPAARTRDEIVKTSVQPDIEFVQVLDHLLLAPEAVIKSDGTPYKVFTSFRKAWDTALSPGDYMECLVNDQGRYADGYENITIARAAGLTVLDPVRGAKAMLSQIRYEYVEDALWKVDEAAIRLQRFITEGLASYTKKRDQLSIYATSMLSPYLRFGLLSIRECLRAARATGTGEKWVSELIWREFYANVLYHFPEVVTEEFNPQYRNGAIPWSHEKTIKYNLFTGRTGYPIIDAAVREMIETGYMHNRARMVVACFATKNLLLDWRHGEEFFAQHLMDYDLASNNGGWQWAASTGTDAAPYFRIFNPILQSQKYDPEGDYIRRYVPELSAVPTTDIHTPWLNPATKPRAYPTPIVDFTASKDRVLSFFKAVSDKEASNPQE